jgi:prepilin-type N-terminal cleavage/methylation domain-containing protein/prepilin-type processing-associated H-X9-DG protein
MSSHPANSGGSATATPFQKPNRLHTARRRGFTMVEILVVFVVIGILLALTLPAIRNARDVARRTHCLNNLRQLGMAFHAYHGEYRQFPPPYVAVRKQIIPQYIGIPGEVDDPNVHTYGEFLLPWLDQAPLYNRIDFQQPYFAPVDLTSIGLPRYLFDNQSVVSTRLPVFLCPSFRREENPHAYTWTDLGVPIPSRFGGNDYGPSNGVMKESGLMDFVRPQTTPINDGILTNNHPSNGLEDIADGASSTALMWEIAGRPWVWTLGIEQNDVQTGGGGWADILNAENWFAGFSYTGTTGKATCVINCSNQAESGVYSFHTGGVNFLLCDGSARFLGENTSIDIFVNLVTFRGGGVVGDF